MYSDDECSPDNCWCSHYDNPYDNYFHTHKLNPAHQYFFWIHEWKQQVQEINKDLRNLGLPYHSKDYVKGYLDAISPEYPINKGNQEQSSLFDFDLEFPDQDEIQNVMARYARAVDRGNWEGIRDVYHPDAQDDHGDYKGNLDGLVAYIRERNGLLTQSIHFLGNCMIEFAGSDVAIVETYFITSHTMDEEAQAAYGTGDGLNPIQFCQFGRYVDRMERRKGEWRIADRICVFESTRIQRDDIPLLKSNWATPKRDNTDPIFEMRAKAGLTA
tara:strand:+ start:232 stop:1047 length:816 start_codon:yes stop_codon:yes gene_type:complete